MTVPPQDLLVYAGGACLQRYGRLWRVTRPADRQGEEYAPTVTRATAGTYIDRDGILRSVAAGSPRVTWIDADGDGVREPHLLIEAARTQVAANPQAPSSWTDSGTPVVTGSQTDPFGGTAAILVEDDSAVAGEGKRTACSFTGDGEKVAIVVARAGTLSALVCSLHDLTTATDRHLITATWGAGTAPPVLATSSGAGTLFDPLPIYDASDNLWWLIPFSATGVVAANDNQLLARGVVASTGTFYLAGGNAWDALYPSSWQGPSLGTRNADVITLPFYVGAADDLTVHAVMARPAHADYSGTLSVWPTVWGIAKYTSRPNMGLHFDSPAREFKAAITTAGSGTQSIDVAVAAGAQLACTVQYDASAGTVRQNQGAGWSAVSAAVTPFTAWGETVLYLGDGAETPATTYLGGGLYALLLARGLYEPSDFTEWLP